MKILSVSEMVSFLRKDNFSYFYCSMIHIYQLTNENMQLKDMEYIQTL